LPFQKFITIHGKRFCLERHSRDGAQQQTRRFSASTTPSLVRWRAEAKLAEIELAKARGEGGGKASGRFYLDLH
jgi:hypothetical protein